MPNASIDIRTKPNAIGIKLRIIPKIVVSQQHTFAVQETECKSFRCHLVRIDI
jgi:hypothetical protein